MTDREMIEQALAHNGFTVERWDEENENGLTAVVAGTFTVIEEDEDRGLYDGDSGKLEVCVVGSAENRNQRVYFGFVPDGYDEANEVVDLTALDYS